MFTKELSANGISQIPSAVAMIRRITYFRVNATAQRCRADAASIRPISHFTVIKRDARLRYGAQPPPGR